MAKKRKKAAKKTRRRKHTSTRSHVAHVKVKKSKKPKRPKKSASLTTWQNYDRRVREWEHKHAQKVAQAKMKHHLIAKHC